MEDACLLLKWGLVSLSAQNLVYVCSPAIRKFNQHPYPSLDRSRRGVFCTNQALGLSPHFEASHSWDYVLYQFPLLDSKGNHFGLLWFDGWLS